MLVILHEVDLSKRCHACVNNLEESLGPCAWLPLIKISLSLREHGNMLAQNLKMTSSMKDLVLKGSAVAAGKTSVNQDLMSNFVGGANLIKA